MTLPSGVRTHANGLLWLARPDKVLEDWLDRHYVRSGGRLQWSYKLDDHFQELSKLQLASLDEVYMVGKGRSLDYITSEHFPNPQAPIFCMNHSVEIIHGLGLPNPIYCCIQDLHSGVTVPPDVTIICHAECGIDYIGHENLFYHTKVRAGFPTSPFTVRFLKEFGVKHITLFSFDFTANGGFRYANIEGVPVVHNIQMSKQLSDSLLKELDGVAHTFATPQPIE